MFLLRRFWRYFEKRSLKVVLTPIICFGLHPILSQQQLVSIIVDKILQLYNTEFLFSKHIPSDLFLCSYFLSGDQGLMFINCIQYSLRLLTYFQPWNVNQHVSVTQQLVDHGIRWLHLNFGCMAQPRL